MGICDDMRVGEKWRSHGESGGRSLGCYDGDRKLGGEVESSFSSFLCFLRVVGATTQRREKRQVYASKSPRTAMPVVRL